MSEDQGTKHATRNSWSPRFDCLIFNVKSIEEKLLKMDETFWNITDNIRELLIKNDVGRKNKVLENYWEDYTWKTCSSRRN